MTSAQARNFLHKIWQPSSPVSPSRVLVLKDLSSHLALEDFLLLLRRDKNAPRFERVIPLRNQSTLESTNQYLLIFPTAEITIKFRQYLESLSRIVNKYSRTSLASPNIVSGPDFGVGPHLPPVQTILRHFTLKPPSGRLNIDNPSQIWSSRAEKLWKSQIEKGGPPLVTSNAGRRQPSVVLRVTGVQLEVKDVIQAIVSDGLQRGLMWDINLLGKTDKPEDGMGQLGIKELTTKHAHEESEQDEKSVLNQHKVSNEQSDFGDGRYGRGQSFLIPCRSWTEAGHFARAWHGLPFKYPIEGKGYTWKLSRAAERVKSEGKQNDTKMYTEVIW